MYWAGKHAIRRFFKSLFHQKEQALSSSVHEHPHDNYRLSAEQMEHLDRLVRKWVDEKGYRQPDHSISETAQRMGTNSVSLYRYCISLGTDFRSWRTRLRILDAQELLLAEPDTPVSLIARRVGIVDRSNFNRLFRAQTGLTPDQWRKNQK